VQARVGGIRKFPIQIDARRCFPSSKVLITFNCVFEIALQLFNTLRGAQSNYVINLIKGAIQISLPISHADSGAASKDRRAYAIQFSFNTLTISASFFELSSWRMTRGQRNDNRDRHNVRSHKRRNNKIGKSSK
jgi:hypothetical protein